MTYLQLINATLRRLRRQEVMSPTASDYATLIGDLVNLAKREVENAWSWVSLIDELDVSTVVGTQGYTLTGFGERYWIQQVHNITDQGILYPASQIRGNRRDDFPGSTSGTPGYWRISGTAGDDPVMDLWPIPSAEITIRVHAKVAQADLSAASDILTVPSSPVLAGAYLRALDERGEDGGTAQGVATHDYQMALSDAIAQDNANRGSGVSSDWEVA